MTQIPHLNSKYYLDEPLQETHYDPWWAPRVMEGGLVGEGFPP